MEHSNKNSDDCEKIEKISKVEELEELGFPSDFIIKVEEFSFPVHRVIIAAASNYFRLMLSSQMKESKDGCVVMKEVDPHATKKCIAFMYHSEMPIALTEIEDVIHASKLMNLDKLAEKCFYQLDQHLSPDTCIVSLKLAKLYNRNQCELQSYILKNFRAIVASDMFPYTDHDDLVDYIEFFSAGEDTERIKWEAITKWVKFQSDRKDNFPRFFQLMNLDLLSPQFLQESVRTEPLVNSSVDCMNIMMESFLPHTKLRQNIVNNTATTPKNIHIACLNIREDSIDAFNVRSKRWCRISGSPITGQYKFGSIGSCLYILGYDGDFFIFDNKTETWIRKPSGSLHCEHFFVIEFQGKLFVLVKHHTLCYDPIQEMWEAKRLPGCRLRFFCAASSEDFIYSVGGAIGTFRQWDQARRYDPLRKRWAKIASMNKERDGSAAAYACEKLYVLGGEWDKKYLSTVECYNPVTNTWTNIISMCLTRHAPTACVYDDKIYVVGGARDEDGNPEQDNSIELYDVISGKWAIISKGRIYPGLVQSCIYTKDRLSPGNSVESGECKTQ
uniref:kelch-like protein 17 n=1 Tax=Styela clava TaxID=7725 RepID=UPI00193950A4|nr:kelch-like protein 17 [Styela clava]